MLFSKILSDLSTSAYYLARLVFSRGTFGLFLIATSGMLCHDFHFNLVFLAIAIIGAALIVSDLIARFHERKHMLHSYVQMIIPIFYSGLAPSIARNRMLIGCVVAMGASLAYGLSGFSWDIFAAWLIGITVCGQALYDKGRIKLLSANRVDIITILALYLVSLPLYLWSISSVPFHVNSDESAILSYEQKFIKNGTIDFFGLSEYFAFPYMPFLVQGWLAQLFGGIDLFHVRLVHGFTGTIIVACSYLFFRVMSLRWALALAATVFVAFNHSLIGINRVVSQTNSGLFLELIAMTAVFEGLKRKHPLATYLGGIFTGLCFYVYYSARLTLPVCLLYILLLFYFKQKFYSGKELTRLTLTFLFGFTLGIAPLAAAMIRHSDLAQDSRNYIERVCLLYPLGQRLATDRWGQNGVLHCIVNGLTVFNNDEIDQIYIYPNSNHGFVDPISGTLVWVGVIRVLFFLRRRFSALFALTGFFFEFLLYSLITFPSPDYTRLLVLLPFAGYFVAHGTDLAASFVGLLSRKLKARNFLTMKYITFFGITVSIAVINLFLFGEFAVDSATRGDALGGTVRYMEARKNQPDHLFVVAAGPKYHYFDDYSVAGCYIHLNAFMSTQQDSKVFAPEDVTAITIVPPFSIFMNEDLWKLKQDQLIKMYPDLVVHKIADQGGLLAIENPALEADSNQVHGQYRKWNNYAARIEEALNAGQFDDAERLGRDYLNSPQSAINGSYLKSEVRRALAHVYARTGKFEQAESLLLQALTIREQLKDQSSTDTADLADDLGELQADRLNWPASEQWYRKAIAIRESVLVIERVDWIAGLSHDYKCLGIALCKQGKFVEAENIFQHASELCKINNDEGHDKQDILEQLAACKKEHYRVNLQSGI